MEKDNRTVVKSKLEPLLEEGICNALGHDWFLHNKQTLCLNCGKEYVEED